MKFAPRSPHTSYLDTFLWVPKTRLDVPRTKNALTLVTGRLRGEPQTFSLWRETAAHLIIPRAFFDDVSILGDVVDLRPRVYERTQVRSSIVLDAKYPNETVQRDAAAALLNAQGGTLQLRCGGGKTVISLHVIAALRVPTLIVVPEGALLRQWQNAIETFLDVPGGTGLIKAQAFDWQKPIVLATYSTLANRAASLPEEVRRWFGAVIYDEGHHLSATEWCRAATICYGRRYVLSATPTRSDGMHLLAETHCGPILYKNLRQPLKATARFVWTGINVDVTDRAVAPYVLDRTGEVHHVMLARYLGNIPARTADTIALLRTLVAEGRHILYLGHSVEALVNLFAAWVGAKPLYDLVKPTAKQLGFDVAPKELTKKRLKELRAQQLSIEENIKLGGQTSPGISKRIEEIKRMLLAHDAYVACKRAERKLIAKHVNHLLESSATGGLIIGEVPEQDRLRILAERQVVFAMYRLGQEALDKSALDTVVCGEPTAQPGIMQQVIGRILRKHDGKMAPLAIILEDDIEAYRKICARLRILFSTRLEEDGGVVPYTFDGHPIWAQ